MRAVSPLATIAETVARGTGKRLLAAERRRQIYDEVAERVLAANRRLTPTAALVAGSPRLRGPEPLIRTIADDSDRYILHQLQGIGVPPDPGRVQAIVRSGIRQAATRAASGRLDVEFDAYNGILEIGWSKKIGPIKAGRRKFNLYHFATPAAFAIVACFKDSSEHGLPTCIGAAIESFFPPSKKSDDPKSKL